MVTASECSPPPPHLHPFLYPTPYLYILPQMFVCWCYKKHPVPSLTSPFLVRSYWSISLKGLSPLNPLCHQVYPTILRGGSLFIVNWLRVGSRVGRRDGGRGIGSAELISIRLAWTLTSYLGNWNWNWNHAISQSYNITGIIKPNSFDKTWV